MSFIAKILATAKALVGFAGVVLAGLNEALPIIPEPFKHYVTAVIGVLTFVTAFYARYAPIPSKASVRGSAGKTGGSKRHSGKVGTAHVPVVPEVKPPKQP